MMTAEEQNVKNWLIDLLSKEGHSPYARLLRPFHVNLTNNPNHIAYMMPGKGVIVLNRGLEADQVSTIVRHEILHEWLKHQQRLISKLGLSSGDITADMNDKEILKKISSNQHEISNIAGDYEISNLGYTEEDEKIAKKIRLNGEVLQGLVTSIDHPEWVNYTYEELYDAIEKEGIKNPPTNQWQGRNIDPDDLIDQAEAAEREANAIVGDDDSDVSDDENSTPKEPGKDGKSGKDGSDNEDDKDGKSGTKGQDKNSKKAKELAKKAKELAKELEKDIESSESSGEHGDKNGNPFVDNQEKSGYQKRLDRIKQILDDAKELNKEINIVKGKRSIERERRERAKAEKFKANPLNIFYRDLNSLIKQQVEGEYIDTWTRQSRKQSAGILRKGNAYRMTREVPVINVYFDRSGSFRGTNEYKTKAAERVLASLQKFERKGQIKVHLYYGTDQVYDTRSAAEQRGWGLDSDPVIEHIKKTQPDNVIVLTDQDSNSGSQAYQVPGASFLVFFENDAPDFVPRLQGKLATKSYLVSEGQAEAVANAGEQ